MSGTRSAMKEKIGTLSALTRVPYWTVRHSGAAPFLVNTRVRFELLARTGPGEADLGLPRASVLVRVLSPGVPEHRWLGRVDEASGALLAQPEPPPPARAPAPPGPALRVRWRPGEHPLGVIDGELLGREPAATGTWTGDPGGGHQTETPRA